MTPSTHFRALLLGTAIGDALGLPAEGLRPATIRRRWKGDWRMRLVFGRGMVSDDTEHAAMTALALLRHPNDVDGFRRDLARRIRWWFACLPPGIGLATARSCIRLWLGINPERSGVWSAGNGPAMRSPIIGAWFARDAELRRKYVAASTRLTHTDPRAEVAAQAIAETAAWLVRQDVPRDAFVDQLALLSDDDEWVKIMTLLRRSLAAGDALGDVVKAMGLTNGVTGYAYHTAPVALYAVLSHAGDFKQTLQQVLDQGGDTDSVGAIAGALLALRDGCEAIPVEWIKHMADWPLSISALEKLSLHMQDDPAGRAPRLNPLTMFPRNGLLLIIVLAHGFRRLIPW